MILINLFTQSHTYAGIASLLCEHKYACKEILERREAGTTLLFSQFNKSSLIVAALTEVATKARFFRRENSEQAD